MAFTVWSAVLALVQVGDMALHIATGQVEPLRIVASLLILGWLALRQMGKATAASGWAAMGAYLGLNLLFLAQAGLTNPAQGGQPRLLLFALVALTLGLAAWLQRRQKIAS